MSAGSAQFLPQQFVASHYIAMLTEHKSNADAIDGRLPSFSAQTC